VHGPGGRHHHVTRRDTDGPSGGVELIVALTGQDGPGVLTVGMKVRLDALTGPDDPRHHRRLGRLGDEGPDRLALVGLQEIGAVEDTLAGHGALRVDRTVGDWAGVGG